MLLTESKGEEVEQKQTVKLSSCLHQRKQRRNKNAEVKKEKLKICEALIRVSAERTGASERVRERVRERESERLSERVRVSK